MGMQGPGTDLQRGREGRRSTSSDTSTMVTPAAGHSLRALLLGLAAAAAVVALRLGLEELLGPRGWSIIVFLGVFAAARLADLRVAAAVAVLAAASRLVLPAAQLPAMRVAPTAVVDVGIDLLAGAAALGLAISLRHAGLRAQASDRAAEARAVELLRAARREAEVRRLAREVAAPMSVRQLADRFARRVRSSMEAEGVTVLPGPGAGGRTAGGPSGAPLARDGSLPDDPEVGELAAAAFEAGRALRGSPASGLVAVPLLAGTGPVAVGVVAMPGGRPVDDDELEAAVLLGRIAGEAMAHWDLARTSRRERDRAAAAAERIRRLQELAADLGRELQVEAIARHVVDAACDGTEAGLGVLSRVDPVRRELELLHARGYPVGLLDRERRLPLAAELPGPAAARTRTAISVDAADWRARFPGASDLPAMAGLAELVALPVGGSTPLAVLVVGRSTGAFDGDDRGFLDAVAEHAAQALRRALLVDLLRDRDRRLGLTLGAARAGSWELDVETRRLEVSGELRRLYGIPDGEPVDTPEAYLARIHPEDREAVRRAIDGAARDGTPFTSEFRVAGQDGAILRMLGVGRTFLDPSGRPTRLMAIDRDVTPERLAEAERERLLEQEREARRLSEAFFGVMSHELRTPVTTIIAGTRLVSRSAALEPGDRDIVDDIAAEADRLHRLIDDLLVLSRLERGNLVMSSEPVHVGHLVRRIVEHEARRWPETRFRLPEPAPREVIEGEETYVEQVLRNLLSNAAKYSPVGSEVMVTVERCEDEVAIRVLDQGTGVGPGELDDLFTLFYRSPATAAAASGAGIGLFVCDRLVRAMGGRIWARRRPEGGSEFGFALRAVGDDEAPDADEASALAAG